MSGLTDFFSVVNAYRRATGKTESTISGEIFNDGKRIAKIRAGGDVGARKLKNIFEYFSKNWPKHADWPDGVARPRARRRPMR